MNKPRYLGINYDDRHDIMELTSKERWRRNYTPFAGYLASKYVGGFATAWNVILKRYVRRKQIVWPDEFEAFYQLFRYKHPEFMGSRIIRDDHHTYAYLGVCWVNGHVNRLFGLDGLFHSDPISPKPEDRDRMLIKLAALEFKKFSGKNWRYK